MSRSTPWWACLHSVQGLLQFRAGHHPGLFRRGPGCKVAAVMEPADGIAGQILPGPVQAGQLAVMGVLGRDVLTGIIPGVPECSLCPQPPPAPADTPGRRHPVGFVGRHYNAGGSSPFSTFCTMFQGAFRSPCPCRSICTRPDGRRRSRRPRHRPEPCTAGTARRSFRR